MKISVPRLTFCSCDADDGSCDTDDGGHAMSMMSTTRLMFCHKCSAVVRADKKTGEYVCRVCRYSHITTIPKRG